MPFQPFAEDTLELRQRAKLRFQQQVINVGGLDGQAFYDADVEPE
jgi:hypothetical protein